jgi:hypothetical protein
MRKIFFLLLLCSGCSTDVTAANDAGEPPRGTGGTGGVSSVDGDSGGAPLDASPPSGGCGAEAPAKCPSPIPSYATDIVPIFDEKCNNCHVGGTGPWPLTDYESVHDWKVQILQDIESCTMPPLDGGTTLSAEERETVLGWLVCGAPNN